jgi:hypothetical protein
MPRLAKIRTSVQLGAQRRLRGLYAGPYVVRGREANASALPPLVQFRCPYCTFWTTNESGRARHILSEAPCNAAQARDVAQARATREMAQRAGIRIPVLSGLDWDAVEGADEEPMSWVRLDNPFVREDQAVVPTPPRSPDAMSSCAPEESVAGHANHTAEGETDDVAADADDEGGDTDDECGTAYVERFPDPRAGQAAEGVRDVPFNLRAYMHKRAEMANPQIFDIAEMLMSTKMDNVGRDVHLKSRLVSVYGSATCPSTQFCFSIKAKLHGPTWAR